MFALGCTIYEIVVGEKLFATDLSVSRYAETPSVLCFTEKWPESPPNTPLHALGHLTEALIRVDHVHRPGAIAVQRWFGQIRRGGYYESMEVSIQLPNGLETPLQIPTRMKPEVQPLFQLASKGNRKFSRDREPAEKPPLGQTASSQNDDVRVQQNAYPIASPCYFGFCTSCGGNLDASGLCRTSWCENHSG